MNFSLCSCLFLITGTAFAQSSSRFDITRHVIASGGATFSTNARFQLGSTIAQPVADVLSSARFSILSGFWIWSAPMVFAPNKTATNFLFSFATEPGYTYKVQYVDSLKANWQVLRAIAGDGSVKTVTDSVPNVAHRFYRLSEQ